MPNALLDVDSRPPRGRRRTEAQMDLDFVRPVLAAGTRNLRGMVRGEGSVESQAGAVRVLDRLTDIQRRIMHQLAAHPAGLNAKELEAMTLFADCGASTVRKRISELFQAGKIVQNGRREGCAVWRIADGVGR